MNHKGSHTPSHPHSTSAHVKKKRGNKAYAASVMMVLLGSALLLSACNPITSQHISLNASAGSGVGAGMMRGGMDGGRNAGMRSMMNADAIGRVVSVSANAIKVELMESTRSSKRNESTNTGTTDTPGAAATGTGAAAGTGNRAAQGIGNGSRSGEFEGTSASDYTTTGEQKTITLATNVQISEISSLMRQGGNAGGFGGGAPAGMGGTATGSPDANAGNKPDAGGNPAGAGNPAGSATGTMSTPNGNSEMKASDLKAGDIVMIWYKDDTQTAERITILPTE